MFVSAEYGPIGFSGERFILVGEIIDACPKVPGGVECGVEVESLPEVIIIKIFVDEEGRGGIFIPIYEPCVACIGGRVILDRKSVV